MENTTTNDVSTTLDTSTDVSAESSFNTAFNDVLGIEDDNDNGSDVSTTLDTENSDDTDNADSLNSAEILGDNGQAENNQDDTPEMFELKFNRESVSVSRDDVISLAQKGLNYDKVVEQRDYLLNDPVLSQIDELASVSGMDRNTFLSNVVNAFYEQNISNRAYELMEVEQLDEDTAYRIANLEFENNQNALRQERAMQVEQQRLQAQRQQAMQVQDRDNTLVNEFRALRESFPELSNLKYNELPEIVRNDIQNGVSPMIAYQKFVLSEKQKEIDILKNNVKIKGTSTGSLRSTDNTVRDAFDEGFEKYIPLR